MPYESIYHAPTELVTHRGITVYYTYKYDEIENPYHYWYSFTNDADPDVHQTSFDVREVDGYVKNHKPDDRDYHAQVIKQALDNGFFDSDLEDLSLEMDDIVSEESGETNELSFDIAFSLNRSIKVKAKSYEEADAQIKARLQEEGIDFDIYSYEEFDCVEE